MANPADIDVERRSRAGAPLGISGVTPPPAPAPTRAREGRAIVDAGRMDRPALPQPDRVADAVDLVGRQVGRAYGYLRSRRPAGMRSDAERVIADNAVLALAAALGFGFVVGRLVRR